MNKFGRLLQLATSAIIEIPNKYAYIAISTTTTTTTTLHSHDKMCVELANLQRSINKT
jgi:hypothetical protein